MGIHFQPEGCSVCVFRRSSAFCYESISRQPDPARPSIPFAFHRKCFMLGEYKVGRCTRQCHAQRRPLREGEWYYSVVIEAGDEYVRHDYSAESWTGPPTEAIGWWKNRMPKANEKKIVLAPPELLVDLLRQMEHSPAKAKSRYLLALMLMRRKILRPATPSSELREGVDYLRVEVPTTGDLLEVAVCKISRGESDTLKDELNELLHCEAEVDESDGELSE